MKDWLYAARSCLLFILMAAVLLFVVIPGAMWFLGWLVCLVRRSGGNEL